MSSKSETKGPSADVSAIAPRRRRSLASRLFTALIITGLGLYVAAVAGLWWTGGRLIEDSARKQAVQWLAELDEIGAPLYASSQQERALQTLAARLKHFPEITYVRYYDASGTRVLGSYTNGKREPTALTPEQLIGTTSTGAKHRYRLVFSHGAHVQVTAPMQIRVLPAHGPFDRQSRHRPEASKVLGYLDFVFDAGEQRVQFQRSLVGGSIGLLLVLVISVVFGRRKIRQALAPLAALEEPLARLARGELNVDMGDGGDREIVAIRDALNMTLSTLKQRDDALRRAESDALTGLVNQRYFGRQLALELSRIERDGESSAVLYIVLDRFRHLDEALGGNARDRMLGQVAGLLRARVRENDLLARFAGPEFVALVRGVNRDGALKVARSINHVIQEFEFHADDTLFRITASIGVAMLDGTPATAAAILDQAKAAAVQASNYGGNRHWLHETEDSATARAAEIDAPAWTRRVQSAIQDDALRLMYQPIVALRAESREMYEVLLRLSGPGGQLVSPTAFLPLADRFGMALELDHWVIRHACAELARLRSRGRDAMFFVNLSGHVFEESEALIRLVGEQLAQHRLDGRFLIFEITEQAAIRHLDQARLAIAGLAAFGCRFALDDFGSGFSSLNYLKHLPAAYLKISGTFVENMMTDPLDEVLIRSIVQIAGAMNMQTVAESVESHQTLQRIAELGVDFAQGHFIARPSEQHLAPDFFSLDRVRRLTAVPPAVISKNPARSVSRHHR